MLDAQTHGLVEAWREIVDEAATIEPYQGMRKILAGFAETCASSIDQTASRVSA